jgi:hypothetical protein
VRPPLDLESLDVNGDDVVRVAELDQAGFLSSFDYQLDRNTRMATPLAFADAKAPVPFDYTAGIEDRFEADIVGEGRELRGTYESFGMTLCYTGSRCPTVAWCRTS